MTHPPSLRILLDQGYHASLSMAKFNFIIPETTDLALEPRRPGILDCVLLGVEKLKASRSAMVRWTTSFCSPASRPEIGLFVC